MSSTQCMLSTPQCARVASSASCAVRAFEHRYSRLSGRPVTPLAVRVASTITTQLRSFHLLRSANQSRRRDTWHTRRSSRPCSLPAVSKRSTCASPCAIASSRKLSISSRTRLLLSLSASR